MHAGPHQRLTTSASAAEHTYTTTHDFSLRRITRSESPSIHINFPISPATTSESDPNDSDTDEDYSDVDFWGRGSPGGKVRSPLQNQTSVNGDSSDEDEDEDNDGDDDDDDEDMSEVDIEEGDEGDRMEIFGHR